MAQLELTEGMQVKLQTRSDEWPYVKTVQGVIKRVTDEYVFVEVEGYATRLRRVHDEVKIV